MKRISITGIGFCCMLLMWFSGIHSYSVTKIEGGSQSLSAFQGKKILVITLPIQQSAAADSFLFSLDSVATMHASQLVVIAVPAREDGYTDGGKTQLELWYRTKLSSQVIITEGVYTRKSSAQQHPLFQWLTRVTENGTFDVDCEGPGSKFFANAQGSLFSVLQPQTRLNGRSVQRTLDIE